MTSYEPSSVCGVGPTAPRPAWADLARQVLTVEMPIVGARPGGRAAVHACASRPGASRVQGAKAFGNPAERRGEPRVAT
jgi:hypothetical protein